MNETSSFKGGESEQKRVSKEMAIFVVKL